MQLDVQQMHARTPAHSRLHGRWLMHQSKPAEHTPNLSWPRAEARPGAINTASTARRHGHSPLEFLGWPALDPSIHCRVGSTSLTLTPPGLLSYLAWAHARRRVSCMPGLGAAPNHPASPPRRRRTLAGSGRQCSATAMPMPRFLRTLLSSTSSISFIGVSCI